MKVKFFLAEEIRPEAGGKMTVLGLFPDDRMVLTKGTSPEGIPPETPRGIEKLVLLISIGEAPNKKLKYKGTITAPDGVLYKPEFPLGEGRIEKGSSHSIVLEFKPFILKSMGVYVFNFYVNKEVFTFPFEIHESLVESARNA